MPPAPVVLFVYNRLRHVREVISALNRNQLSRESDLYIYSDGAKKAAETESIRAVREYLKSVDGFKSITITERDQNVGLARSIIDGVTEVCETRGRVITLEDDLVVSPYFLQYMNEALERYESEGQVMSIHGYVYPVKASLPETFFLKDTGSWGWATWKRAWDCFESDGSKLLEELTKRGLRRKFDMNGSYPFTKILMGQVKGGNDSWAIRWQASAFLNNGLTLFPGRSLVKNIGHDSSGTHCGSTANFDVALAERPIDVKPIPAEENADALAAFEQYFRSIKEGAFTRIRRVMARKFGGWTSALGRRE